jgi:hypothetical protein
VLRAEICNLKVVTDASPDYSDMASLVQSITSKWATPKEKCWAMFYWNHIARRQTAPMILHGMELTDPIRQFNDYGFTMCSTISGINNGIWEHMGLQHRFWDICNHTVAEVNYDNGWHMYDNSLSMIYTLCDGKTLAGVQDIGKEGACELSGGKSERGHIAKYHALCASSRHGFCIGADDIRSLDQMTDDFTPSGLKHRTYYYNWDFGHRYILNLKEGESYTRNYHSLGKEPKYYVPNGGHDPEAANERYHIRGNGQWTFKPSLAAADFKNVIYSSSNIAAVAGGLQPEKAGAPAEVIYKIQSANVTTAQTIQVALHRKSADDKVTISISTNNGLKWKEVWAGDATGDAQAKADLLGEVNGAYEILVKVSLLAKEDPADAVLKSLQIDTTTEVNSKTQPKLNLGRNTIYVGAGEQLESAVFWPDLQGSSYKNEIVDEQNVDSPAAHIGYTGALHVKNAGDGYVTYRMDAPSDITRVTFGGRFYNRAPNSHCDLLYSLDDGKNWTLAWSLADTQQPWDVIHYEKIAVPAGHRSVLLKYLIHCVSPADTGFGASIYAARMEANYAPGNAEFKPIEVTYSWRERQKDYSTVARSHTQLVEKLPFKYTIDVGGVDHPVMDSLAINIKGARGELKYGYSDGAAETGKEPEKFVGTWVTYGNNIAVGKPYTTSIPSENNWGAGDPDGKKLTDGVVGSSYSGGASYGFGAIWSNKNPVITLDLGESMTCASIGLHIHGYPPQDALKNEVQDKIEIQISDDGKEYKSIGLVKTALRFVEIPVNHMLNDEETLCAFTARLIPEQPVKARFIKYNCTSPRFFDVTELEVLDAIKYEPFDLRVALPEEK